MARKSTFCSLCLTKTELMSTQMSTSSSTQSPGPRSKSNHSLIKISSNLARSSAREPSNTLSPRTFTRLFLIKKRRMLKRQFKRCQTTNLMTRPSFMFVQPSLRSKGKMPNTGKEPIPTPPEPIFMSNSSKKTSAKKISRKHLKSMEPSHLSNSKSGNANTK